MSGIGPSAAAHYERLAQMYDRRWQRYHEAVTSRVLRALRLRGTERLLDVGCGTGELGRHLTPRYPSVTVVGADLTFAMLQAAQRKLADAPAHHVLAHAEVLPFGSAQFDAVACASVLHCVPQPRLLVAELARALRPGGRVVIADWSADGWFGWVLPAWLRRTNPSFVRMYRAREVCHLLADAGLTVHHAEQFWAPPCYALWLIGATTSPRGRG